MTLKRSFEGYRPVPRGGGGFNGGVLGDMRPPSAPAVRPGEVRPARHKVQGANEAAITGDTSVFADDISWLVRYTCDNADGSTWSGDGSLSPPTLSAQGTTQGAAGSTSGLLADGIGATRVDRAAVCVASALGGYATSTDPTQVGGFTWPSGDYTIRYLLFPSNVGTTGVFRWRSLAWSGNGIAGILHRGSTNLRFEWTETPALRILQLLTNHPHGAWAFIDIFYDNTNANVVFRYNGSTTTFAQTPPAPEPTDLTTNGDFGLLAIEGGGLPAVGDRMVGFAIAPGDIGLARHVSDTALLGL